MKHFLPVIIFLIAVFIVACATSENVMKEEGTTMVEEMSMPFGGADDVAYAQTLWEKMERGGFNDIPANLQPGKTPHGAVIEILEGKIDGKTVVMKRNYGGEGVSVGAVEADRAKFLAAITVMAAREEEYDPDNFNWFWVKYKANGDIDSNPKGMALAGRVAKGMDTGCIACHQGAGATEMVFAYDESNNLKIKMVE